MAKETTIPAIQPARRQQPSRRPQNLDLSGHVNLNKPLPQICRASSGPRSDDADDDDDDDKDDEGPNPVSGESMEVRFCLEGPPVSIYHHHRPAPAVPRVVPYNIRGRERNQPGLRVTNNEGKPAKTSSDANPAKPACPMPSCKGLQKKSGLCRDCEIQPRLSTFASLESSGTAAQASFSETSQALYDALFEQVSDTSADSGIPDCFCQASIRHRKQHQKIEGYAGRRHGTRSHEDSRTQSGSGSGLTRPPELTSRYASYSNNSRETELPILPLRLKQKQPYTGPATPVFHSNARSHGRRLSHSSDFSPLAICSPVSPLSAAPTTNRVQEGFHPHGLPPEGGLEILSSQKYTVPGSSHHRRRPSITAQQTPRRSNNNRGDDNTSREYSQFESFFECRSPEPLRAEYELFTTAAMKEQIRMRAAVCDHHDGNNNEDGEGNVLEVMARLGAVVVGHTQKVIHQRAPQGWHGQQQQEQPSVVLPRTPEVYDVFSGDEYPGPCPGPYWF